MKKTTTYLLPCSRVLFDRLFWQSPTHKKKKTNKQSKHWNFFVTFPYLKLVDTQMLRTWNRIITTPLPLPFPCKILNHPSRSWGQLHSGIEVPWQIGQRTRLAIRRVLGLRPTLTTGWTDLFLGSNEFSSSATLVNSRLVCLLLLGFATMMLPVCWIWIIYFSRWFAPGSTSLRTVVWVLLRPTRTR